MAGLGRGRSARQEPIEPAHRRAEPGKDQQDRAQELYIAAEKQGESTGDQREQNEDAEDCRPAMPNIRPLTVRFSPGTLSLISAKRTPQSPPQKMSLTICGTPVTPAGVIDHGTRG